MAQAKTSGATGSGGKTSTSSARKSSTSSASKSGTGSARKTAGSAAKSGTDSTRKSSTSSASKSGTGSARKTAGSAAKSGTGSASRSGTGSARKTAGSASKSGTGSARKTAGSAAKSGTGSARKSSTGSARKTAGSAAKSGTGSARKSSTGSARSGNGSKRETGIYVYGILPADIELTSDEMFGVGDPPGQVGVVRSDDLAALVSEVDLAGQLGTPDDLMAHKEILDATAAELPVLPLRFGAVLASEDAVAEELLAANHDEFAAALDELDGVAQYVVKGRYTEEMILDEVLSENKQAARLRDKIHGKDADITRDDRIQLGEMINQAVTAKRNEDTRALGEAMEGHCVASLVREPSNELDAVHVAFLVNAEQESEMERVIEDLARDWDGRIEVRLLGPMAAYDFVGAAEPEG